MTPRIAHSRHSHRFSTLHFTALALAAVTLLASITNVASAASPDSPQERPLGDSRVLAPFPANPGFPEGIAVDGRTVYVSGPAQFGNFLQPVVVAYDIQTGAVVAQYPLQGQNPFAPQAGTGLAFDNHDRLYVGDLQQGVIRINVEEAGAPQELYATALPDLPTCAAAPANTPCSPTAIDRTPLINDLVFDHAGNLYITDSFQATIWKVAEGGGAPEVWFQSPTFDTDFGPNGMRLNPADGKFYITVTFNAFGQGFVYTLPNVAEPTQSDLAIFHQYNMGEGPDGIAFGKSGKLYVALAASNQIGVLRADGTEEARYGGPSANPDGTLDPLPWANPAAIAFNDKERTLLVTNHAIFFPNPGPLFAVFDVFVDDKAAKLERPNVK
jgi:sugar lactone lactonase YvrE